MATKKNRKGGTNDLFKPTYFKVKILLDATGETFPFKVYNEMTVGALKAELEFLVGLPVNLQRLWYLDEADLSDHTDIKQNCVVPDATVHVSTHYSWVPLVEAVCRNNSQAVFDLGVTVDSDFTSPNVEFLAQKSTAVKKQWFAERSFLALFMAAHRGHVDLCQKLVSSGSRVNRVTSCGRSALHVAASRGHGDVMDVLLEHGAKATMEDKFGETPSTVALKFGHKDCDRHLFMFKWRQRAKRAKKKTTD